MDIEKLIERLRSHRGALFEMLYKQDMDDAATAIEALRADLARVTTERDAAVWDLETTMAHVNPIFDTCGFCKNAQCYARGGIEFCHPEWRGIRKED